MDIYEIEHEDTYWNMRVEIDPVRAKEAIIEMVDFWSGSEERLKNNYGDYTITFLKQLAEEVYRIVTSNNYNLHGIVEDFASESKEGWSLMDGSSGIKITYADLDTISDSQFRVKRITK